MPMNKTVRTIIYTLIIWGVLIYLILRHYL